jgi:hypothetical protein
MSNRGGLILSTVASAGLFGLGRYRELILGLIFIKSLPFKWATLGRLAEERNHVA